MTTFGKRTSGRARSMPCPTRFLSRYRDCVGTSSPNSERTRRAVEGLEDLAGIGDVLPVAVLVLVLAWTSATSPDSVREPRPALR